MISKKQWSDIKQAQWYLLATGWTVTMQMPEDTLFLKAELGEWLLELTVSDGLTDECVLARPATENFIRLRDRAEFDRLTISKADEIKELWESRADDRRFGPAGTKG